MAGIGWVYACLEHIGPNRLESVKATVWSVCLELLLWIANLTFLRYIVSFYHTEIFVCSNYKFSEYVSHLGVQFFIIISILWCSCIALKPLNDYKGHKLTKDPYTNDMFLFLT